ncbi:MAG: hypothetical protein OXU31_03170 [Gammaproteobacteria bacterium]|nr:hypothetical protein [Gammaproteobacteria bacterium]
MSRTSIKISTFPADREAVAAFLRGAEFARFIAECPRWREFAAPEVMPVAVLPEADARAFALDDTVRLVGLSAETAAAKAAKHGNTVGDWRQLQGILDSPEYKFFRAPFEMLYYRLLPCGGKLRYRAAVVKRTRDGRWLFVKTMHWADPEAIASAQKKWEEKK